MPHATQALPRALKGIAVLQAAMNAAHFAAMPMLALLIIQRIDNGVSVAGTALAIYFCASRIGPILLAPAVDRLEPWRGVFAGLTCRGLAFTALPFASQPAEALLTAALLGLGQGTYEVGLYGVIGRQDTHVRNRLLVLNDQALNLGCVLGPLSGVALTLISPDAAFLAAGAVLIVLSLACLQVQSPLLRGQQHRHSSGSVAPMLQDSQFLLLCLALIPFWAVFAQLFAAFPLLAARFGNAPAWANSILVVNGLAGVAALACLGPLVARGQTLLVLIFGLILSFASIAGAASVGGLWGLLLIVALFSVGESCVMLAGQIFTARHAEGRSATVYFGAFKASAGVGAGIGSYLGVLTTDGHAGGFLVLAAIGILSLGGLAAYARHQRGAPCMRRAL